MNNTATKATFTPGPWKLRFERIFGQKNRVVADVCNFTGPEDELFEESKANAHLIAAAPEMYEALKLLLLAIEIHERPYEVEEFGRKLTRANPLDLGLPGLKDGIRAVIAKAEGHQ